MVLRRAGPDFLSQQPFLECTVLTTLYCPGRRTLRSELLTYVCADIYLVMLQEQFTLINCLVRFNMTNPFNKYILLSLSFGTYPSKSDVGNIHSTSAMHNIGEKSVEFCRKSFGEKLVLVKTDNSKNPKFLFLLAEKSNVEYPLTTKSAIFCTFFTPFFFKKKLAWY